MKALVVVDMQNDFITGSLGSPEAQAIVPNVKKKIEEAAKNGDLIIYTKDTHFQDYLETKEGKKLPVEHCLIDSDGWQIPDELLPPVGYTNTDTIEKYTFGSLLLAELLARVECDEIELVGLCTDICVVSNALLLKARLYNDVEISVDAECCAGVTPESHEAALRTMAACQINVYRKY
jgi:nicotinamidase-related amidase